MSIFRKIRWYLGPSTAELRALNNEYANLDGEIAARDAKILVLQKDLFSRNGELFDLRHEAFALRAQIEALTEENENLTKENVAKGALIDWYKVWVEQFNAEYARLTPLADIGQRRLDALDRAKAKRAAK